MSEAVEQVADVPPADIPQVAIAHRAGLADINETAEWLLPRVTKHWKCSPRQAISWFQLAVPSNDQALIRCGDAMGMAHVQTGRLGWKPRINVDFVLSKNGAAGFADCEPIFRWLVAWATSLDTMGLFRIDSFSDADRTRIKSWIGALNKEELYCLLL